MFPVHTYNMSGEGAVELGEERGGGGGGGGG